MSKLLFAVAAALSLTALVTAQQAPVELKELSLIHI